MARGAPLPGTPTPFPTLLGLGVQHLGPSCPQDPARQCDAQLCQRLQ